MPPGTLEYYQDLMQNYTPESVALAFRMIEENGLKPHLALMQKYLRPASQHGYGLGDLREWQNAAI